MPDTVIPLVLLTLRKRPALAVIELIDATLWRTHHKQILDNLAAYMQRSESRRATQRWKLAAKKAIYASKALKKDPDNSVILEHLKEVLEV